MAATFAVIEVITARHEIAGKRVRAGTPARQPARRRRYRAPAGIARIFAVTGIAVDVGGGWMTTEIDELEGVR